MPAMIAAPPSACAGPAGSPKITMPATAPTSGSMFTNAPATSADTLVWPKAKSVNGSSVPHATSATVARRAPGPCGPCGAAGRPSAADSGTAASAAPRN
jgi:hypothetical protein